MANIISRLGVVLGLDSAEFVKGLEGASRRLEAFGDAVERNGKIAATALVAASAAALRYADEIVDVAKANDVAVDSVIKLSNALANSGGSADNAGKLLASFTGFVDKAADGSLEAQKAFAKAGVSLKDLASKDTQQLFETTVQSIAAIGDPLTRNATAMEVFGKAAKGVDFVALADEMRQGDDAIAGQARALEDAAEMFDRFAQVGRDALQMIAVELGPPLKQAADYMKSLNADTSVFGEMFKTVFQTVSVLAMNVAYIFMQVGVEIGGIAAQIAALMRLDFKGFAEIHRQMVQDAEKARLELTAAEARVMGGVTGRRGMDDPRVLGAFDNSSVGGGNRRTVKPAKDPEAEKALADRLKMQSKAYAEMARQQEETAKALAKQQDAYTQGSIAAQQKLALQEQSLEREQALFQLSQRGMLMRSEDVQLAKDLMQIEWRHTDAVKAINEDKTLDIEGRKAALERVNALQEREIELARERNRVLRGSREGSFADGFQRGAQNVANNLATEMERGQQAFDSVMGNMSSALENFVRTGKLSFKSLAQSIIQDLILIQLRAQASSIMSMLVRGLGSAGVGSSLGPDNIDVGGGWNPARANGGPVDGGKIGLVGERGPELFVPRTAGTIVPNNQLAAALGGGQTVNYNGPYIASMSAIDTQSAMQFLAKNKAGVWSAYQSANRSVPMSR